MDEEKIDQILKNQISIMKILRHEDIYTVSSQVVLETRTLLYPKQEESIADKTKDAFCEKSEVEE